MRILIVDDEIRLAEALGQIMIQNKYIAEHEFEFKIKCTIFKI